MSDVKIETFAKRISALRTFKPCVALWVCVFLLFLFLSHSHSHSYSRLRERPICAARLDRTCVGPTVFGRVRRRQRRRSDRLIRHATRPPTNTCTCLGRRRRRRAKVHANVSKTILRAPSATDGSRAAPSGSTLAEVGSPPAEWPQKLAARRKCARAQPTEEIISHSARASRRRLTLSVALAFCVYLWGAYGARAG